MSFTKIKQFILQNKKSLLFLVFLVFAFLPELGFAVTGTTDPSTGTTDPSTANPSGGDSAILQVLNEILKVGGMIIGLLTQFVGLFLTPEWSSGTAIGFGNHLKELWILVSNIVYTIFAIILIVIALMNIIGKGTDTWELKQALPKFIVGVLIVPFSWFIVAALIGLSNILTVSLLSLPHETFGTEIKTSVASSEDFLCKTYVYGKKGTTSKETGFPIQCGEDGKMSIDDMIKDGSGVFNIMTIYTYKIMNIKSLGKIGQDGNIKEWVDLLTVGLFDIIFFIIFLILLIAIGIALFVRGIYLWLFTILSPVFGLMYFFGSDKMGDLSKFSFSNFLGLVMVPVYVATALSLGLIFIGVIGQNVDGETCKSTQTNGCIEIKPVEGKGKKDVSIITILGINIEYHGPHKGIVKGFGQLQGSFGELILKIFGLVILWIALMAALERSEITKAVVAPIKSFGDSIGQLAMKAPSYAPIIPAPSGGTMSATAMGTMGSTLQTNINSKFTSKGNDMANKLFNTDPIIKAIQDQTLKINKTRIIGDKNYKNDEVVDAISRMGKDDWNDSNKREQTLKLLGNLGIDSKKLEGIIDYSTAQTKLPKILKTEVNNGTSEKQYKKYIEEKTSNNNGVKTKDTNNTINITMPSSLSKDNLLDLNGNVKINPSVISDFKGDNINLSGITEEYFKNKLKDKVNDDGDLTGNQVVLIVDTIISEVKKGSDGVKFLD